MKLKSDPEAAEIVQTKEIPAVVQERLVRGGVTYGVTIRWTDRNGQQSCGVDGCETREEAWEQAEGFARRGGWTPPKWWQWWRWHDTRLPSANV
jgi:hypothetical protein